MESQTPKSFWKRPEGVTGKIILGLIAAGGIWGLYTFLPLLVVLLQNTLYAAVLLGVVGAITFLALDPRFRNLIGYGYKSIMRVITGLFIQLDPIGIIESYIGDLKKNLGGMNQQIVNLNGQMKSLKNVIDENTQQMSNNLKLASVAKEKCKNDLVILKSRKAGRLKESNETLTTLYVKMEKLYRVLTKMYETAGVLLEDIQDEVDVKKRERKAILAGHSAFKSAMKIIQGDQDKQSLFNQSMEFLAEDLGAKVGEMERFMEMSANFMDSVDIQNGIFQEEGLNLLEEWEKEGSSILLGDQKKTLLAAAENEQDVLDLEKPVLIPNKVKENRYTNLYKQ